MNNNELVGFFQHKENPEAFGRLRKIIFKEYKDNKLVTLAPTLYFEKTKFVLNPSKSVPRFPLFCLNDQLNRREKIEKGLMKEVDNDFYNHFNQISSTEYIYLEFMAEKKLLNKI